MIIIDTSHDDDDDKGDERRYTYDKIKRCDYVWTAHR